MKQNFYKITASNRFQAVIQFLRKELGWKQGDPLVRASFRVSHRVAGVSSCAVQRRFSPSLLLIQFTYINLAFSPAPDDTVANLFKVSW